MILRLLLTCLLFVSPSWCGLTPVEFNNLVEKVCFENDEETGALKINGQKYPLASTLENFIALAEKFEMNNMNIGLKSEIFYFIRRFVYENIKFQKSVISTWTLDQSDYSDVDNLWEQDEGTRAQVLRVNDPFTDEEKCSLFFMLSHSVIETAKSVNKQRSVSNLLRSYTNATFENIPRSTINPEELYPQEQGVVAILGTEIAVSLSRVLTGIYVGLNENRKRSLDSFPKIQRLPPPAQPEGDKIVDPLYALTLAEILTVAQWPTENRDLLALNGMWKSIPIKTDQDVTKICPMVYKLENADSAFTYSSVRGAADGLVLGKISANLERKSRDIRLSQLLRMYYSRGGIVESVDDRTGDIRASFCLREANMEKFEETLKEQVLLFNYLISKNYDKLEDNQRRSWDYYMQLKNEIFKANEAIKNYCDVPVGVDKPENLPLETPLDVIVVLDSTDGEDSFIRQQIITGYFAKQLDLRYFGSRLTVLKDVRVSSNGVDGKIELESAVSETHSSSCAACEVLRIPYDRGNSGTSRDQVIFAIDQLLEERKKNETKYNGANGKVVVYFNFDDDTQFSQGNKDNQRLLTALRNLHIHHQDVTIYAVGKNSDVLKRFAKQDTTYVLTVAENNDEIIGNNLFKKIAAAPARLQYTDCEEAKSENSAVFDYVVSPNVIQHWEMPTEYLYKSRGIKFFFESQNGATIRVCHNRANKEPELNAKNCQDVTTNKLEFKDSNPCKSASVTSCSPYFFAVIGVNSSDSKPMDFCVDTTDVKCRTLDQIKFKFSHEGLRCSGSVNLVAVPAILMLGLLISRMFTQHP